MPATVFRTLRVKLDDPALLRKGDELATLSRDRTDAVDKHRLIARKHRAALKELNASIDTLVEDINNKSEEREVECRQEVVEELAVVRTTRLDTNVLVEERGLTAMERQSLPAPSVPQGDGTTKTSAARVRADKAKSRPKSKAKAKAKAKRKPKGSKANPAPSSPPKLAVVDGGAPTG